MAVACTVPEWPTRSPAFAEGVDDSGEAGYGWRETCGLFGVNPDYDSTSSAPRHSSGTGPQIQSRLHAYGKGKPRARIRAESRRPAAEAALSSYG